MLKTYLADLIFTSPFVGSAWIVLFSVIVSSAIIFNAWFRRFPFPWATFKDASLDIWEKTKIYLPNALWQQVLLVTIFFWLRTLIGLELALVVSALFFGLIGHMGNPALMGWCAAMGLVYCLFYNRYPNVWILVFAHGYLGTVFHSFTSDSFNQGMRVWRRD